MVINPEVRLSPIPRQNFFFFIFLCVLRSWQRVGVQYMLGKNGCDVVVIIVMIIMVTFYPKQKEEKPREGAR